MYNGVSQAVRNGTRAYTALGTSLDMKAAKRLMKRPAVQPAARYTPELDMSVSR
jgi:hypothetical protein